MFVPQGRPTARGVNVGRQTRAPTRSSVGRPPLHARVGRHSCSPATERPQAPPSPRETRPSPRSRRGTGRPAIRCAIVRAQPGSAPGSVVRRGEAPPERCARAPRKSGSVGTSLHTSFIAGRATRRGPRPSREIRGRTRACSGVPQPPSSRCFQVIGARGIPSRRGGGSTQSESSGGQTPSCRKYESGRTTRRTLSPHARSPGHSSDCFTSPPRRDWRQHRRSCRRYPHRSPTGRRCTPRRPRGSPIGRQPMELAQEVRQDTVRVRNHEVNMVRHHADRVKADTRLLHGEGKAVAEDAVRLRAGAQAARALVTVARDEGVSAGMMRRGWAIMSAAPASAVPRGSLPIFARFRVGRGWHGQLAGWHGRCANESDDGSSVRDLRTTSGA